MADLKDATPRPWRLAEDEDELGFPQWRLMFDHKGGGLSSLIATVHGHRIPVAHNLTKSPGGKENALLIIKAVNNYDRLRAELAEATRLLREVQVGNGPLWNGQVRAFLSRQEKPNE